MLLLPAFLILGLLAGAAHFLALRENTRLYLEGRRHWLALAVQLARLTASSILFVLASLQGTGPLLAAALGFLLARAVVLSRLAGAAP
ncbi:N-ATPase subunit AtpR [Limobrevibacterium gyesilva]|uniref:ATP synthase subunit I n=1 Tax=Limobrevibacterium gyesilva TaxID=2991712 RepID=A0AA41YPA8_9PROT|nr:ATP synthase subunit I [Limobrevibacterium gyesilva]MCW3476415.1 hypothetical protein [Limobrevibacterium gyesilva]